MLDIPASYALLLGRPWLHPLGAVPSTVHRKVKIPWQDGTVMINAQEEVGIAVVEEAGEEEPLSGFQVAFTEYHSEDVSAVDRMNAPARKMMRRMRWKKGVNPRI